MIEQPASIFNDVIGPVMRGPSSSHVAAAARMGQLVRQMVDGKLKEVIVEFDPEGSLATTYHGHGSDMGFVGGLLGFELSNSELTNSLEKAKEEGIQVEFKVVDYQADHPNTYRITAKSDQNETVKLTAISVGGGMIEIKKIEGFSVSIKGDFYENLIFFENTNKKTLDKIENKILNYIKDYDYTEKIINDKFGLINIKSSFEISNDIILKIKKINKFANIISLSPVLPVMSRKNCEVPFRNSKEMLKVAEEKELKLWELATLYESMRGDITEKEVFDKMKKIVRLMENSIEKGFKGTSYKDRILGPQAWMIQKRKNEGKLIPGDVFNSVIASITSMMEIKSSLGVIVAAPTAGACGGLPGTLIGASKEMDFSLEKTTKAMLAAGLIGIFIAEQATFAAEVGGCQVECGAGSGMAAGGLVQLFDGTATQGADAASMALQNSLGMICDPVADRVEVPCLGKNVMAGVNALASANMSLAGFDKVIPLDEVIDAMYSVGHSLPSTLRCTGNGGLSITETAMNIDEKIN